MSFGTTICPSNPALVIFIQYFIYCRNEEFELASLKEFKISGRWWSYELILLALNINYFKCHRRNKTIASPLPHVCLIFFWSPTPLPPPPPPQSPQPEKTADISPAPPPHPPSHFAAKPVVASWNIGSFLRLRYRPPTFVNRSIIHWLFHFLILCP